MISPGLAQWFDNNIKSWMQFGWLSHTDRAFVAFIAQQENTDNDLLLWASALVSQQLSIGEVYLDLAKLTQHFETTLGINCLDEDQREDVNLAKLKAYSLQAWTAALLSANVVETSEGNSPLVLSGNRLYLRRYWQCQQVVDEAIASRVHPHLTTLPEELEAFIETLFFTNVSYKQTLESSAGLSVDQNLDKVTEALLDKSSDKCALQTPSQNINLSPVLDWQKIACVLALRSRFSIITGGPGTGKTTTLTKLLALIVRLAQIEDPKSAPLNILLAAPTGKAAARVSESIAGAIEKLTVDEAIKAVMPTKASTLHRLLGSRPNTRQFKHHRHNPLVADIVIIDEASMIDLEMMASVLVALPPKATLILLGDKDQLASVEAGSVLGDLCLGAGAHSYNEETRCWIEAYAKQVLPEAPVNESLASNTLINQQTIMLLHSYRFGQESGIGHLAKAVNQGDYERALSILADSSYGDLKPKLFETKKESAVKDSAILMKKEALKDSPTVDKADNLLRKLVLANWGNTAHGKPDLCQGYGYCRAVIKARPKDKGDISEWATQVLKAFDTFQVLCALRKGVWGVEGLNQRIESWLVGEQKPQAWYEGRPVMITSNDYALGLMNGDIGIALRDHSDTIRVVFPADSKEYEGGLHWVSPLRLPNVETAYAMTVHKSQGSEFNHVALVLPDNLSQVLTRELIYTGITRAKEQFSLVETRVGILREGIKVSCAD